jgi:Thrombospondin type 3 repeat
VFDTVHIFPFSLSEKLEKRERRNWSCINFSHSFSLLFYITFLHKHTLVHITMSVSPSPSPSQSPLLTRTRTRTRTLSLLVFVLSLVITCSCSVASATDLLVSEYSGAPSVWQFADDLTGGSRVFTVGSGESRAAGVAVFPDGRYVLTTSTGYKFYVINADHTLNKTFSLASGTSIALDGDLWDYNGQLSDYSSITEAYVYTSRSSTTDVTIIDLNTNAIHTQVYQYSGDVRDLYAGTIVPTTQEYWALCRNDAQAFVFDLYTRQYKRTVTFAQGQGTFPGSAYYSALTNTILISTASQGNIYERQVDTDATHVNTYINNDCTHLFHVVRHPVTYDLYATGYSCGKIYRYTQSGTSAPASSYSISFTHPMSLAFVDPSDTAIAGADVCPSDPNKTQPGQCGCGELETDTDSDGIADCVDNCPNIANPQQEDGDSDGIGDVCSCPLEDTSCNYQPDPPVVTFSDVVIGDDDLAYYRIQMNASAHWSEYVKVLFPDSDSNWCDYPASKKVTWAVTTASDDPCTKQYSVDIAVNDFLGKCGFTQAIRNGDSLFFQQTAQILTNRTCEDGRINQLSLSSDVELSETRSVSRETQYEIEIVAPTNTTAKTGGLEVFGTAFKLDLLGDLTITPDIDTNMPTISGFFVTETQHPYELQDPVFALTGDFNYATFELTGTYCTADNSTRLPCQQTWSYSFQPNQTCPDKAQLEGELIQITWNVNCSDGFIGECAPSFAVQPEATFTLNSPVYCFSSDYIELTPALEVYQFDQLTANSANFGASTLGTLTDNGFSVERVFTIDSQLYAEYTVVAAGTGVTLTATTLKKVSTTTSSRGELVLYETNAAEQVITQATTFSVHDSGFGTDESSDFADYRTRFQFTWLNDTTVLLDSTEDLAQTIALSATAISIFTNVQSLRKAGIDERHPVLSKLNSDQHSKEQEDKHMILFADGDEPRDSKTTVLARLAPASTTNTPAASTASSGFVVTPTVAAAGIALIAVVALVAFAVIRRTNDSSKPELPHQLPASSSGVQLTDFSSPVTVQTTMNTMGLEGIAASYDTTMQYQY